MREALDTAVADYTTALGLGEPLWHTALDGGHPVDPELSPRLCATARHIVVLGIRDATVVNHIDLLDAPGVAYRARMLGDQLEIDGHVLGIPRGKGEATLDAIAQANILRAQPSANTADPRQFPDWPTLESYSLRDRAWLDGWLGPHERLLAWLDTDETWIIKSAILGETKAAVRYVLTTLRHGLFAMSRTGESLFEALPDEALVVTRAIGRDTVGCGEARWRTTLTNDGRFVEIAELPGQVPGPRARKMARLLWGPGKRPNDARVAELRDLLETADGSALALLTTHVVFDAYDFSEPVPAEIESALNELGASELGASRLAKWWRDWDVPPERALRLIADLRGRGDWQSKLAGALHVQIRAEARAKETPLAAGERDLGLADHLLALGDHDGAAKIIEDALAVLPSPSVCELLPDTQPAIEDDEASDEPCDGPGMSVSQLRVALLERAVATESDWGRVARTRELFALEPLVTRRSAELARLARAHEPANPALERRADRVHALLTRPGGLDVITDAPDHHPRALPAALREEVLQHPEARVDGVLGKLQTMLAKVSAPDCSALKAYCERVHLQRHPHVTEAVSESAMLLGIPAIETFISRGEKSIGVRAYEAKVPFLLVGGDHLDPKADAYLDPRALRFAVAAELGHLRFKHNRVTPDEVVAGGIELGIQGLNLLLAVTPFLKSVYQTPIGRIVDRVSSPVIDKVKGRFDGRNDEGSIASDTSELIAAHRVMQYTADRAGLVACRSPEAAVRAMLAGHPAHLVQRVLARRNSLVDVLDRHPDADDEPRARGLALRVAALLAFSLSEDYERLIEAAFASE